MAARYDVNNSSLGTLLANIKSGELAIPELQRPFVWNKTQVCNLIDSLYKGIPVGYLIEWKNPNVRLKDGTTGAGKKVLIDGQQRITAFAAAIVGQQVMDKHYKWERISIAFNPLSENFEVCDATHVKSDKWIADISEVFDDEFDPFNFVVNYCEKNGILDKTSQVNNAINKLCTIRANDLGVITLADDLGIDDVTEIFHRINDSGTKLSSADFVMSKISSNEAYEGNITRKIIDYFCHLLESPEDLKEIEKSDVEFIARPEFNKIKWAASKHDPVYKPKYTDVLRVAFTYKFKRGKLADLVSLLSGRDFQTKEFKIEIEEKSFYQLKDAVLQVVDKTNYERFLMIVESTGIIKESLVRSENVLNFGYALYLLFKDHGLRTADIEHIVRRWIVLAILTKRYSGSSESMIDYDIKRFNNEDPLKYLETIEAGEFSDAFWAVTLVENLNTSASNSPYYSIFLAAQVKGNDNGFLSYQNKVQSMLGNRGDVHHLFPKNYLIKYNVSQSQYNQIANYALLKQDTNVAIGDKAPNVYMGSVCEQCETKQAIYGDIVEREVLRDNLIQNCIPEGFENMDISYYDEFLEKRRKLMAEKIRNYYWML